MAAQGEVVEVRTLGEREYRTELFSKLGEEVTELTTSADVGLDDVVDLLEVIGNIATNAGLTEAQIKAAQNSKRETYGSFGKRQFVGTVEIPEGNEWLDYLRANPERYPEIL
jgi:predicted house-cleaning noncanonical NTP pyrophosphatase (MazG superfamily)